MSTFFFSLQAEKREQKSHQLFCTSRHVVYAFAFCVVLDVQQNIDAHGIRFVFYDVKVISLNIQHSTHKK